MSHSVDREFKEEVDELCESLTGEWHDLAICVILIGKVESLLYQTIVADILSNSTTDNNYNKGIIRRKLVSLLEKVTKTKDKDGRNYFNYKEAPLVVQIEHLIDVIASVEKSKFGKLIREYVRTEAIMTDSSYSWFENDHCGKIAKKGLDLPPTGTRAEAVKALKRQCSGLIHEVISVMTESMYGKLRENVLDSIIFDHIDRDKLDKQRIIRNAVVHKRTSHCFQDDVESKGAKERKEFFETYAAIVSCCVVQHDCFLLASDEEKRKKKTEYMKPKAHFNLVHKVILDYNEEIKKNQKQMEEDMAEDKRREIEEATKQLEKEREDATNKYQDLLGDVEDAQKGVEEMKKQAKEELDRIQNDGNRNSIDKVVVALEDIGELVRNIGKKREVQQTAENEENPECGDEAAQEGLGDENLEGGGGAEGEGEDTIDQQVGESMSMSNATPTKDPNETQSETTIPKAGKRKRQNQKEKKKKQEEAALEKEEEEGGGRGGRVEGGGAEGGGGGAEGGGGKETIYRPIEESQ